MNDPKSNGSLLDEMRVLKERLALEERKAIALQAALDLKEDQLKQAMHERDYYHGLAHGLSARASQIMTLTYDMINEAADKAKILISPERNKDAAAGNAKDHAYERQGLNR